MARCFREKWTLLQIHAHFTEKRFICNMPAILLGPAPGGYFLQFKEDGDIACDDRDPVSFNPLAKNQVLYRYGELYHDNIICLKSLLACIHTNNRNPITNTPYNGDDLAIWESLISYMDSVTDNWHTAALEAVRDYVAFTDVWDGQTLHWPEKHPIVSNTTPIVGGFLKLCTTLVVPATVQSIDNHACQHNLHLKQVLFAPDAQLQYIRSHAFAHTSLQAIDIPASVLAIEDHAFSNSRLHSITFTDSNLQELGERAFSRTSLISITLPASLKRLADKTFMDCITLSQVTFEKGSVLDTIGENAFCVTGLKTIRIPAAVKRIESYAFYKCQILRRVFFEKGSILKQIDHSAFAVTALSSFRCPASLRHIGSRAFGTCKQLKTITLPTQLEWLGIEAFQFAGLTSIALPDTLKKIYMDTFFGCKQLKGVRLGAALERIGPEAFAQSALETLDLPASVQTIDRRAFEKCLNLRQVTFASDGQLTRIDSHAFDRTALVAVHLPASVQNMGCHVFANNKALVSASFAPNSRLQRLGEGAFSDTNVRTVYGVPTTADTRPSQILFNVVYSSESSPNH